jgi:hypothetical protein
MEKFIKVYDNIIPLYQQDYIERLLTTRIKETYIKWVYNPNLTGVSQKTEIGFSLNLLDHSLSIPLLSPFYKFCESQKIIPLDISLFRTFLVPPSPNPSILEPHTDQDSPHLVFLYYVNDSDGDTIFYDSNQDILKRVSPKKGRIILFNGLIPHSGSSPSKSTRILININFNPVIHK